MLLWSLAFLGGVVTPTTWPSLPPVWMLYVWAIAVFIINTLYFNNSAFSKASTALLLGVIWCCYRGLNTQIELPDKYFHQPILASGRILSSPDYQPQQLKFEYLLETVNHQPCQPIRILLTEHHYKKSPTLLSIRKKERWQLSIRLKKPRGFWNPDSFDYQAWLLQRGILATGVLVKSKNVSPPIKLDHNSLALTYFDEMMHSIEQFRFKLGEYLRKSISRHTYLGLLQALVIGARNEILPAQWAIMRATGTNHLFAISGLHIGFIGGIVYSLTYLLWRRMYFLCLWMPAQQAAYLGAWVGALSYSAISGFALPIQRAIVMFTLLVFFTLQRRTISVWQGWCTALLVMLSINPFIVLSESFWLSFGAVAIIFYGRGARLKYSANLSFLKKIWESWGGTQWVVSVGLVPITLWFFQQVSILGFFANLIAIPCVGFIVLPFSLIGALCYPIWPQGIAVLIAISEKVLEYLWIFLSYMAANPFAQYTLTIPNRWILLSTSLSALLFISPKGFQSRYYLGSISLLPLLLWKPGTPSPGELWLTLLDVGQGLSAIIQTHRHTLVYDTGPRFSDNLDAGSAVVVPYLRTLGRQKIDTLIVSHGDNDHSGGLQSIVSGSRVSLLLTSDVDRLPVRNACYCKKGQNWEWDGVKFSILHPPSPSKLKGNDASCVLKVNTQTHQLLLPGDIHKKGEETLLFNTPDLDATTLLIAPHHGSKTSSTLNFIERIMPQYVLFPVGYQNRFGFPHRLIIDRYKQYSSKLYSTANEGAITVKFSDPHSSPILETFYGKHKRFWHARSTQRL